MNSVVVVSVFRSNVCKCLLALLFGSLLAVSPSFTVLKADAPAYPCTLGWDPSPDSTVAGYAIYYSQVGSTVTNRQDVGMTNQATLFDLAACASYNFYVVAYDSDGVESPPSNIVTYSPEVLSCLKATPAAVAGSVNIRFYAAPGTPCHVEYTPTLNPAQWQTLSTATADDNGVVQLTDTVSPDVPARFYRAATP